MLIRNNVRYNVINFNNGVKNKLNICGLEYKTWRFPLFPSIVR